MELFIDNSMTNPYRRLVRPKPPLTIYLFELGTTYLLSVEDGRDSFLPTLVGGHQSPVLSPPGVKQREGVVNERKMGGEE